MGVETSKGIIRCQIVGGGLRPYRNLGKVGYANANANALHNELSNFQHLFYIKRFTKVSLDLLRNEL